MTPIEISNVLLFLLGVVLSLVFRYIPEAKAWFDSLPHQGLAMLGMIVVLGAVYFGLSCTPFAVQLHIAITCELSSVFNLLEALALIAAGNQLTYLLAAKG